MRNRVNGYAIFTKKYSFYSLSKLQFLGMDNKGESNKFPPQVLEPLICVLGGQGKPSEHNMTVRHKKRPQNFSSDTKLCTVYDFHTKISTENQELLENLNI